MKFRLFGCRKFRFLTNEELDRALDEREARFMEKHRAVCRDCAKTEEHGALALNMLRMSAIDADARPSFDERVIRNLKVQSVKTSLSYWSPAVLGAAVAGLVVLAALQMIASSSKLPTLNVPGGEAKRIEKPSREFPSLELRNLPNEAR